MVFYWAYSRILGARCGILRCLSPPVGLPTGRGSRGASAGAREAHLAEAPGVQEHHRQGLACAGPGSMVPKHGPKARAPGIDPRPVVLTYAPLQ